ncbi:hypothetical protein PS706_00311 [Pseudomonas fluorescens]|nr:hypothetical protein PS706_00311 [Pseudomonas fluorescens]
MGVALCLRFGRGVTHLRSTVTFRNLLREKPIFIGLQVIPVFQITNRYLLAVPSQCGSGLAREGGGSVNTSLTDTPPSRASPLPQGISTVCQIPQKSPTRLTPNGALSHQPALRDVHGLVRFNQMRDHTRVRQGGNVAQPVVLARGNLAQDTAHDFPRTRLRQARCPLDHVR